MKKEEWNQGLNHIDPELVEEYIAEKDRLSRNRRPIGTWLRFGAIAACACLLVGGIAILPLFREEPPVGPITSDTTTAPETPKIPESDSTEPPAPSESIGTAPPETAEPETFSPVEPVDRLQMPTSSPLYYGSESAEGTSGISYSVPTDGISVTARVVEILEDTYTFFCDWEQREFRLLRMETVKLLGGTKMAKEFYYIVPAEFMMDFTIYHRCILVDMSQYGLGYSVIYNKTQNCAEQLDMPLFGYQGVRAPSILGLKMIPFDMQGYLDLDMWNSSRLCMDLVDSYYYHYYAQIYKKEDPESPKIFDSEYTHEFTLEKMEALVAEREGKEKLACNELENLSDDAVAFMDSIRSFENGIYVHDSRRLLQNNSPTVQLLLRRYINGFPTNEKVRIVGGYENRIYPLRAPYMTHSKAQFTKEDEESVPDLAPFVQAISEAYDAGEITPPHIQDYENMELREHGIFGWYAQTENGIIGIVRVTISYQSDVGYINDIYRGNLFDDLYFILESESDAYKAITRDDLLARIGEYETDYIFTGEYDEYGKVPTNESLY